MANYSFRETRRLRHLRLALGVLTISLPCAAASGTTATTLTLAPTAVSTVFYAGEAITYTATVSGASGTPTGTGTVTFTIDGSISTPFAVDPSHNATIVLHPSAGTHSIGASYSGDSIYSSSVSNTLTMAVNKAVTAVQMASNPPQIAQPVSIRAAVTIQSPGDGLIGGTVDFANGTSSIAGCKGVPVQNGVAICSTAFPQVESVTIGATYSGDSNTATSTGSLLFTVGKCSAGVYLAAYPAAPANGAPVTLGVLVLGATGVAAPTGTVTISDGTSVLANLPVGPDGRTALTVPSGTLPPLGTGTHTLMAGYSGDANYGVSQAPALTVVITGKAATTTALTSTTAQIAQLVKISATVSMAGSASGSASGTVDFSNAANPIAGCAGVPLQNGVALCNTSFSQTGTVTINATYSGDTNNAASKGSMQLTIGKSISSAAVSAAPAAPSYGAVVTLTALVTGAPGVANPSGTVAFSDGTTALGTAALGADGRASLVVPSGSLPALGIGTHSISAAYSGDTNYLSATAPPVAVVVTKPTTAVTLSSPSAQIAQPVKITAAISPGTAGGTVDFSNAANPIAGCTGVAVQNGAAVCNTSFPQLGTVTIGARYSGDANNQAGTGSLSLTIGKCNAGVFLAATPAAPVSGAVVTLSTLVTGAPGVANPTGTVTFSDGTIALGTATLAGDGRASLVMPSGSLPALGIGTHGISAAYSGDTNYLSALAPPVAVVVTKPSTAVTLSPPTAQIAQPVKITAAISPGTAGGTVDFSNAANPIAGCTGVAVQNGAAVCSTSFPQLGTVTIAASYSGDANNSAGTGSLVLTVGKCNAGAYLAGSPAAPVYGAAVTLGTLVMGTAGVANPTGTVTFSDGTAALGTLTLGSDGHATLVVPSGSLAPLITGSHNVTAVYSGDANYLSATAPPLVVVVGKAASTVALAAAPNSPKPGQNTTLTATVSPAGSGTVAFSNGTAPISGCTAAPTVSGTAVCATSFPGPGTFTIAASYAGDANTNSGTGSLPLTVAQAVKPTPVIALAATPTAPVFGAAVTFTLSAAAAAGGPMPTGTVAFSDGTAALATLPLSGLGQIALTEPSGTLAPLSAGTHTIAAAYSGDSYYAASTPMPLIVTVGKASTSTVLTASYGGAFTATVTVLLPGAGTPTGQVQFSSGGASIGTAALQPQGANFVATLPRNTQSGSIAATYLGDTNFGSSTSAPVTVNGPQAQATMACNHNPSTFGQAVTFTVYVTNNSGPGTPTGSVQLLADGTSLGTASLAAGVATFTTAALAIGIHNMMANYAGDATYPAASAGLLQVVSKAPASLALSPSPSATVFGQPVTFTAQLDAQSAATAAAGPIQFSDGPATLGSAAMSAGTAALTVTNLAAGTHSITASWSGDGNWGPVTSAALLQAVGKAQTTTRLAAPASSSTSGPATLSATVSVVAPGAGVPTGSVKFVNAATNVVLATVALTGAGAATPLPQVSDPIVAVYSGDANFQASTSDPLAQLAATNSASYATLSLAADEIVTLFGSNLGAATSFATPPADSLAGTNVKIADSLGVIRAAQIFYVSPAQASVLVPAGVAPGPATLTITNSNQAPVSMPITIGPVAPGLFTANSTGQGVVAAQVIRAHADGTQDPPQTVAVFDTSHNLWVPALIDLGLPTDTVYLLLYGTGIRHYATMPTCTVAGKAVALAFAGAQGSFPGLDQVNLLLPSSLRGAGTVNLVLTVDGTAANTVTLAIQ